MTESKAVATDHVVAVAGDWHGDRRWAAQRIEMVAARGATTLLHLGDFGIWPGRIGKRYLLDVESACETHGVEIWVTPGNHEDWGRLEMLWSNPRRGDPDGIRLPLRLGEHVHVLPRGHRWQMAGRSFVSLGGAPSIDYQARSRGTTWWPQEMIQAEDVEYVVARGPADVMLTHDAPGPPYSVPRVTEILRSNPLGWPRAALEYAEQGRIRVTEAFEAVQPRLLIHGHYHVSDQATVRIEGAPHATEVWSLACEAMAGNLRFLDLERLRDADQ